MAPLFLIGDNLSMLRTFIQISALGLTLVSAIILTKGNLSMSPQIIAQLSVPRAGEHPLVIMNLCDQYATTLIGVIILVAAFGLQLGNSLWEMGWSDFKVDKIGVSLAVLFCIIVLFVSWWLASLIAAHEIAKVEKIIGYAIPKN